MVLNEVRCILVSQPFMLPALFIHCIINFECIANRENSEDANNTSSHISGESLVPSNFSRAYFKNINRTIPTDDGKSNTRTTHITDIRNDISIFQFSVSTPRNLVVEDVAGRAKEKSLKSLKRYYNWINKK